MTVPSKDFSHSIFEISDNIDKYNIDTEIYNLQVNGHSSSVPDPRTYSPSDPGNSNPGLPDDIYGLKFELKGLNEKISFDSTRAPMWGDIYAKDGQSAGHFVYAYNKGLGTEPGLGATDFTKWIAVPNSHKVQVPEPATYLIMLSSLALAGLARRKMATA